MKSLSILQWPRTLFFRLTSILFIGLVLAQTMSFLMTMMERDQATINMMKSYIRSEVASSVALLDHLPADQRTEWLPRLARRSYDFILDPGISGGPPDGQLSEKIAKAIGEEIGTAYPLSVNSVPGGRERLQVHLRLSDGTPLTIDVRPMSGTPMSPWLPLALVFQLALLASCCWLAVRIATRPLHELAQAADTLGPDLKAVRLGEDGPSEVVRAARAFNSMQDRIAGYTKERMQILAAISHDLQTPITRMRLRLDVMDENGTHAKLQQDLREMENLVKEGIAYVRTMHSDGEVPCRIDPDALLDSLVCDYVDAGQNVSLHGRLGKTLTTRPQALRRILGNLIDNALKFAGAAEISIAAVESEQIAISVRDRGPGIPPDALNAVFQPFYRIESSRNRHTGGTGLGLAIARQLTVAMNASLTLHNRAEGGLEARLLLKNPSI